MKSMTGFGRAKQIINGREYNIEIKSVNHKYNDINIKLPRNISYIEEMIRKQISNKVARGKIDVYITFNNFSIDGKLVTINKDLAKLYINQLKELANDTKINDNIEVIDICKFPDILQIQTDEENEDCIKEELSMCLEEAINNLNDMKTKEGIKIKEDLIKRMNKVDVMVTNIFEFSTGLIEEYVVKLKERIQDLLHTDIIDETRIAQETVIYSDKCSIEEELTRLKSHIKQFRDLMELDLAIGKKLDFIIQEMNRETNTIGSKSVKLEITNLVIDIKTELENIREQIQNIE
ncbi:MAG: YicC family protein [Clostridia bacterium]|nr:YicC family protein [Clostridia bacterium]